MPRSLAFASLSLLCAAPVRVHAAETAPEIDVSTSAPEIMLSADAAATNWLAANYPLKSALTKEQTKSLATPQADGVFVGAIFDDGTPGALLMKFSPSKKTLTRFTVLRWSKDGWVPLLLCGRKGPLDAKGAAITETDPVDVYEIYMRRRPGGLGFLLTLGNAGDKLFGDPIVLSYDSRSPNYVWPDNWSHD